VFRAQKHKKDCQVVSLFTLSGSARAKAAHKYVDEIGLGLLLYCFAKNNKNMFVPL
jgi:hypothetical protein